MLLLHERGVEVSPGLLKQGATVGDIYRFHSAGVDPEDASYLLEEGASADDVLLLQGAGISLPLAVEFLHSGGTVAQAIQVADAKVPLESASAALKAGGTVEGAIQRQEEGVDLPGIVEFLQAGGSIDDAKFLHGNRIDLEGAALVLRAGAPVEGILRLGEAARTHDDDYTVPTMYGAAILLQAKRSNGAHVASVDSIVSFILMGLDLWDSGVATSVVRFIRVGGTDADVLKLCQLGANFGHAVKVLKSGKPAEDALSPKVREALDPATTAERLVALRRASSKYVRAALLMRPDIDAFEVLAKDKVAYVRCVAARQAVCPEKVLVDLALDPDVSVRTAVSRNPSASDDVRAQAAIMGVTRRR